MAIQDLLSVKACSVNYAYSDQVCSALNDGVELEGNKYAEEQANVQALTGAVLMWRTMLENLFPMVLVCLIGAWSDKYGRKIPMLLVMLSFILQHFLLVFCSLDTSIIGANSVGLISSLIVSLTGNNACFIMCIFSYVSDTTSLEKLSQKTAITGSSIFFGMTVGLALAGVMAPLGFVVIFTVSALVEFVGFLWLLYGLPEVIRDEKAIKGVSNSQKFRELLNMQHISDAIGSGFKSRPGNDRLKLLALLVSHSMIMAPMFGEGAVIYLFSKYKFNWDAGAFSAFMTYRTVVGFIGNFVSMILLGSILKLSDPAIGIVSCATALLSLIMFAYANSTFIMYFAPIVALLSGSIASVPRSIIFKIVPGSETGKVNALIGSLESLTPLLITPAFSYVYTNTFEYLPGAFFLLSAAFMVPPMIVFTFLLGEKTKAQ
jgi:PCFT/HCP family folate transporter-like MFS transporter 1/3